MPLYRQKEYEMQPGIKKIMTCLDWFMDKRDWISSADENL